MLTIEVLEGDITRGGRGRRPDRPGEDHLPVERVIFVTVGARATAAFTAVV